MKMDAWTQRLQFRQAALVARAAHAALQQGQPPTPTTTPAIPNTAPPPYAPEDDEFDSDDDDDPNDNPPPAVPICAAPMPIYGGPLPIRTDRAPPSSMRLMFNASRTIQGSGNVLPLPIGPLLDTAKISAVLKEALHFVNGVANENTDDNTNDVADSAFNGGHADTVPRSPLATRRRRHPQPIIIDLTIDCGIRIVGDRNILAPWALRIPPPGFTAVVPATSIPTPNTAGDAQEAASNSPGVALGAAATGTKRKAEEDVDETRQSRKKSDTGLSSPPASA